MGDESDTPLQVDYEEVFPQGPVARWRTHFWAAIVAAVVSAIFGVALSAFVINDVRSSVRAQVASATIKASKRNCLTQVQGRQSANRQRFAERELLRFDTDILTASARNRHQTAQQRQALRAFLAHESAQLVADYKQAHIVGLKPVHTFGDLFPYLNSVAQLNCDTALLSG